MESPHKYDDFSFVNRKHHTACFAGSEPSELTLHLQKHTPDPFTVPASARDVVKVKDCKISKENVLLLCQTARVYCNSYIKTATRKRLDKRIEDVTSRRRAKRSESKLIPLEGYEPSSQRRNSPSPRSHSPSPKRHSPPRRKYSPSPRRHSPSPRRHVPTRGHLSRKRSTSQPTKSNATREPNNEPLNPYRVLPNIHSNRKLSTELSPHDRESSRSSSEKRNTENQASTKYDKYQSQHSQNGKSVNTRSTKENVRSEGDNRDNTFIAETKYKRTVTYGSKEDEKRFNAKRGHDSEDDYSDNE
ncbi:serine/arginine repetitive matrix protein 1-like isoform X2 [Haliotis rubra]|uniref:serine/arginine repetitive matrix protein 1-like isoform X2 n=1 Tax=Haliotis rubra TaxID=36100 RepID=UPI001EE5E966|nr:serine/arginine repetitive matrix protein 1-like isoform X2 [Haliotis rubra]